MATGLFKTLNPYTDGSSCRAHPKMRTLGVASGTTTMPKAWGYGARRLARSLARQDLPAWSPEGGICHPRGTHGSNPHPPP